MYCSECGTLMKENDKFCSKCGASAVQSSGDKSQVQPEGVGAASSSVSTVTDRIITFIKKMNRNQKIITGIILSAIVILLLSGSFGSGVDQSSPEATVKSMFQAIERQDAEDFLSLMTPDSIEYIKSDSMYNENTLETMTKTLLVGMNLELTRRYGADWVKQANVLDTIRHSADTYEVGIEMFGETDYMFVYRIGDKFYLDADMF